MPLPSDTVEDAEPLAYGGSGIRYQTVAAAQAVEAESVTVDVTGAGTTAGVVVGTGALSAVDDFYKDFWLVLTDPTPGDGLVCRYARVSAYVGATKTFTIDQPWDFGVGETYEIISPIRITLTRDVTEDVTFTKNVELDLAGHRLRGRVDQTAGSFCWIRGGGGYVTNGVEKTNIGVLWIEDCSVSRRDATIYAVRLTSGSDLGRCELVNSRLEGVVSSRRGRMGWRIVDCLNSGITDSSGGVPYRLVESVAGVAVVVTQFDAEIDSELSGAFFYSENSLTGGGAYISIQAAIRPQEDFFGIGTYSRRLAICRGVGAATLTLTMTTGAINITDTQSMERGGTGSQIRSFAFGAVQDFTGTFSFLMSAPGTSVNLASMTLGSSAALLVEGTVNMTGTATVGGTTGKRLELSGGTFAFVSLDGPITTGSATVSGTFWSTRGAASFNAITFLVSQTVGAPAVTVSITQLINGFTYNAFAFAAGITVSVGTYTLSGAMALNVGPNATTFNLSSAVTGGTWTVSGAIEYFDRNQFQSGSFFSHAGTGGTMTVSNTVVLNQDGRASLTVALVRVTSTGTINVTSATILWRHYNFNVADIFLVDVTAAGVGSVTGAVTLEDCLFQNTATALSAAAGGTATGPSSLTFENCIFRSSFTDAAGAGVITWAAATLLFRNIHVEGLFTFVGTRFSVVQAFETVFNGNSANLAISFSGVRPATYEFWGCRFPSGRPFSTPAAAGGQPDIMDDWVVLPNGPAGVPTAKTAGQLVFFDTAGDAITPAGGESIEGVVLRAVGAVAGTPVIAVRRGIVPVLTDAVAAGDDCQQDAVANDRVDTVVGVPISGRRVCRALVAAGAGAVAYSVVNLM